MENQMKDFLLIRKGSQNFWNHLAADERKRIMSEFTSFVNDLNKEGRVRGGHDVHSGIGLSKGSNGIVVDGPFAETKETLNGYLIFKAANMDDALACAKRCPALGYGESLEMYEMN